MLCASLGGSKVWGRMDTYICMAESLPRSPEIITTLLIGSTPMQSKNLKRQNIKDLVQPSKLINQLTKKNPVPKEATEFSLNLRAVQAALGVIQGRN